MLALGPRLLSRALGILPLLPAVPSLGHDAPYGHGDPPEPGNTAPRGLGSSEVSTGIPMDCGPRSQLVTTALGAGGMQERGMQDMHGREWAGVSDASWTPGCYYHKAALVVGLDSDFPGFSSF